MGTGEYIRCTLRRKVYKYMVAYLLTVDENLHLEKIDVECETFLAWTVCCLVPMAMLFPNIFWIKSPCYQG
jgi:hypothetical protein